MDAIFAGIKDAVTDTLGYINWVDVIDGELFFPAGPALPIIGLVDGGESYQSMPGKKDIIVSSVGVVAYQHLVLDETGRAIVGAEGQIGPAGKGLIAIGQDLRALLNDNFLSNPKIHFAHMDAARPAVALDDGERFVVYKRFDVTYRRYQ